jgi:hypothetical protein
MTYCRELIAIACKGIQGYYKKDTGLFSVILSDNGEYPEKKALLHTHNLISLIGISEHEEISGIDIEKTLLRIMNQCTPGSVRELALGLWLASKQHYPIAHSVYGKIEGLNFQNFSSMEYSWLLVGLLHYIKLGDAASTTNETIRRVKGILLQRYNKKTNLFFHKDQRRTVINIREHIATFADQIYTMYAFAESYLHDRDQRIREILENHSSKLIALQGPLGQWWWHYNAQTGCIAGKYPAYAVHQDSMAPFAFFKLKEATGFDHLASVQKGIQWLAGNNELGYNFLRKENNIILRGVKRRGVLQRIQNISSFFSGNDEFLDKIHNNRYFQLMEKEHSYHLGWILYAFNNRNRNFWCTD